MINIVKDELVKFRKLENEINEIFAGEEKPTLASLQPLINSIRQGQIRSSLEKDLDMTLLNHKRLVE